jgi:hypothetical protein
MKGACPTSRAWLVALLCCLALCLTATGCGSKGSVSGKVLYKGEPLGGGSVLFVPQGQPSISTRINADGVYTIDNIAAGPVKISVETKSAQPGKGPPRGLPKPPPGAVPKDAASIYNPAPASNGKYVVIPDNYSDPEKSELTYTVVGGSQTHNIDLK